MRRRFPGSIQLNQFPAIDFIIVRQGPGVHGLPQPHPIQIQRRLVANAFREEALRIAGDFAGGQEFRIEIA